MSYSTQPLRNRRILFLGTMILVSVIGAGFALSRTLPSGRRLHRGQYRVTVVGRSSLNQTEGGLLRLSISEKEKGAIPAVVMYAGSSVSVSIDPERPDTKTSTSINIIPRGVNSEVFSDLKVVTDRVTTQTSWFGMARQETRTTGTGRMTLSDQPFLWKAQDGVYPQGAAITLGTVEGKPVRLQVGYPAKKP